MLNEIQEYQQLTCELKEGHPTRLLYDTLNPDLSGLNRALTTLARGFLYDEKNATISIETSNAPVESSAPKKGTAPFACTTAFLRAWCGHGRKVVAYRLVDKTNLRWVQCDPEKHKFKHMISRQNCLGEEVVIQTPENADDEKLLTAFRTQFPCVCAYSCEDCPYKSCKEKVDAVQNWLPRYIHNFRTAKLRLFEEKQSEVEIKLQKKHTIVLADAVKELSQKEVICRTVFLKPIIEEIAPKGENGPNEHTPAYEALITAAAVVDNATELLKKLHSKRAQFSKSLFRESFTDSSEYSLKEITYERVITNAYLQGPLKVYHLVYNIAAPNEIIMAINEAIASVSNSAKTAHLKSLTDRLRKNLEEKGFSEQTVYDFISAMKRDTKLKNELHIMRQAAFDKHYGLNAFKRLETTKRITAEKAITKLEDLINKSKLKDNSNFKEYANAAKCCLEDRLIKGIPPAQALAISAYALVVGVRNDEFFTEEFKNKYEITFNEYYALAKFKKIAKAIEVRTAISLKELFSSIKDVEGVMFTRVSQEKLLRLISIYFLGQSSESNYHDVVFNHADFSHWLQTRSSTKNLEDYKYYSDGNQNDLFTVKMLRNNTIKLGINNEWLNEHKNEHQFEICENIPQDKDYIVFSDDPQSKYLRIAYSFKKGGQPK